MAVCPTVTSNWFKEKTNGHVAEHLVRMTQRQQMVSERGSGGRGDEERGGEG